MRIASGASLNSKSDPVWMGNALRQIVLAGNAGARCRGSGRG